MKGVPIQEAASASTYLYSFAALLVVFALYVLIRVVATESAYAKRVKGLCKDVRLPYDEDVELYHNTDSFCSQAVRACLYELDIPFKSHHIELHPRPPNLHMQLVDGYKLPHLTPKFKVVNPWSTVPVIVHKGYPVYESKAILRYLNDVVAAQRTSNKKSLVPTDDTLRMHMDYWAAKAYLEKPGVDTVGSCIPAITSQHFLHQQKYIKISTLLHAVWAHPLKIRAVFYVILWVTVRLGLRKPPLLGVCRKVFQNALDEMEDHFSRTNYKYLAGDHISIADIAWIPVWPRILSAGFGDLIHERILVQKYFDMIQRSKGFALGVYGTCTMSTDSGLQSIGDPWKQKSWILEREQRYAKLNSER